MKVAVVHPLKHHVYHSMAGAMRSGAEVIGLFGYYDKNDIIDRLIKKTKYKSLVEGYQYPQISKCVKTNPFIKILFLMSKLGYKPLKTIYKKAFEKWVIYNIKNVDCIHVLQDYVNEVIRFAHDSNKKIVYEQITVFCDMQDEVIKNEINKWNLGNALNIESVSKGKKERQIENLEYASVVIGASQTTWESIKKITNKRIYTFPYGANINTYSDDELESLIKTKKNSGELKVLYVGSIGLIKGVRYIIKAAEKLKDTNIRFTFVGKPLSEIDKNIIKKIISMNNCVYIESIPHTRINELYRQHDVFVFQSLCDGFGMVTLEAMSNGLPCIVSEGGRGIIRDGIDGFINKNGDFDSISKQLLRLHNDRNLLCEMSRQALISAKNCTWEVFEKNIKNVYDAMI